MPGNAAGTSGDQQAGDDHAEQPTAADTASASNGDDDSVDEEQLEEYQEMLDSLGVHPVSLKLTYIYLLGLCSTRSVCASILYVSFHSVFVIIIAFNLLGTRLATLPPKTNQTNCRTR